MEPTQTCSYCNSELPLSEFHKNGNTRFGVSLKCKECTHKYDVEYYSKNREKILENKKSYYKSNGTSIKMKKIVDRFEITKEEYDYMNKMQDGLCAICGLKPGKKGLAVDHCHNTGEIRGLLCGRCNTALGSFRDDKEILLSALSYLGWEG